MTLAAPLLAVMTDVLPRRLEAFGARQVREGGVHSPEELKLIVSASRRIGVLEAPQEQMIQRALDLENVFVREVMVPRPDIFSLPGDMSLDEAFQRVADAQHSRVPVYDPQRGPEHIIGVLYAKDLMRWLRYRALAERLPAHATALQRPQGPSPHARSAGGTRDQASARPANGV